MTNSVATEVTKCGKKLICPICEHDRFSSRKSLLNTRGASFFNLDWANKTATNYTCEECGYIYWFLDKKD